MFDQFKIDDFSVELMKTEPDDVAQILGIHLWKFTLQRDADQEIGLEAVLSINSPDEPENVIDKLRIFTNERQVDGMVAIYPLGESLLNAEEVRVYLQLGSGSISSVIPNPFKGFSSSYTANPADVLENKNLRLMAFSDGGPMPSQDNTFLSFSVETFME